MFNARGQVIARPLPTKSYARNDRSADKRGPAWRFERRIACPFDRLSIVCPFDRSRDSLADGRVESPVSACILTHLR